MAQGHATIRMDVKTFMAFDDSTANQYEAPIIAMPSTIIVKYLPTALVKLVKPASLFLLNASLLQSWVR